MLSEVKRFGTSLEIVSSLGIVSACVAIDF